ncbi:MAG: putative glycoside hydrolase [Candidatus Rokuibacteriota bacterium]
MSAARRNFYDGSYVVALLAIAIMNGYLLLPTDAHTREVSTVSMVIPVPGSAVSSALPAGAVPHATAPATPMARVPKPADLVRPPAPPAPLAPAVSTAAWPEGVVSGRVLDPDRQPAANVSVVAKGVEHRTDAEGRFKLEDLGTSTVVVKLPGYERVTLAPAKEPLEVVLKPQAIKAAYLTYYGFGDRGIRTRVLDLLERTELNAVVIDVKGDRGWVIYRTNVEQALAAGAQGPATLRDFDAMMADLKSRGIYTIARIVTFKDNVLANARPDLAIIDTRTGKPWIDNEKLAWVDPFREEVWSYNIALAREAAARGFDEIQFDYVRFPTDGKLGAARYLKPNNRDTRLPAIAGFLERARKEIGTTGAFVAADVFGYVAFNENDTDIGQRVEELAPHLDYMCPMVYPSGYQLGIPGYRNPVVNAYEVVRESVRLIKKRSAGTQVRVRPWLQDFRDYAFDRRVFGPVEIRSQIRGSDEGGGTGWMLWNPRNEYTGQALRQKESLAAR